MPTILIVDDEPNIPGLVRLYLTNDGHEALPLARTEKPDLTIWGVGYKLVDR